MEILLTLSRVGEKIHRICGARAIENVCECVLSLQHAFLESHLLQKNVKERHALWINIQTGAKEKALWLISLQRFTILRLVPKVGLLIVGISLCTCHRTRLKTFRSIVDINLQVVISCIWSSNLGLDIFCPIGTTQLWFGTCLMDHYPFCKNSVSRLLNYIR